MEYKFTKMHGLGNDYIYFTCFKENISNPSKLSKKLSDRHFGIGADGIILVCPSNVADAKMKMYNADGSEGAMCGNGIRCVGKFLFDNNIVDNNLNSITIETLSGIKKLDVIKENNKVISLVVDMDKPILTAKDIPVISNNDTVINEELIIDNQKYNITCVSMGNPHCVVFTNNIDNIDLEKLGPKFENNEIFPDRINTEFIEVIDNNTLKMRVWERGSGETLACGTGACASVVAAVLNNYCSKNNDVKVKLRGGDLSIKYTDNTIYMTGPADTVFEGAINLEEDL